MLNPLTDDMDAKHQCRSNRQPNCERWKDNNECEWDQPPDWQSFVENENHGTGNEAYGSNRQSDDHPFPKLFRCVAEPHSISWQTDVAERSR